MRKALPQCIDVTMNDRLNAFYLSALRAALEDDFDRACSEYSVSSRFAQLILELPADRFAGIGKTIFKPRPEALEVLRDLVRRHENP